MLVGLVGLGAAWVAHATWRRWRTWRTWRTWHCAHHDDASRVTVTHVDPDLPRARAAVAAVAACAFGKWVTGSQLTRAAQYATWCAREHVFGSGSASTMGARMSLHDLLRVCLQDGILLTPRDLSKGCPRTLMPTPGAGCAPFVSCDHDAASRCVPRRLAARPLCTVADLDNARFFVAEGTTRDGRTIVHCSHGPTSPGDVIVDLGEAWALCDE
jgi:hypothetical protein